jgi:hypothetical protein
VSEERGMHAVSLPGSFLVGSPPNEVGAGVK